MIPITSSNMYLSIDHYPRPRIMCPLNLASNYEKVELNHEIGDYQFNLERNCSFQRKFSTLVWTLVYSQSILDCETSTFC